MSKESEMTATETDGQYIENPLAEVNIALTLTEIAQGVIDPDSSPIEILDASLAGIQRFWKDSQTVIKQQFIKIMHGLSLRTVDIMGSFLSKLGKENPRMAIQFAEEYLREVSTDKQGAFAIDLPIELPHNLSACQTAFFLTRAIIEQCITERKRMYRASRVEDAIEMTVQNIEDMGEGGIPFAKTLIALLKRRFPGYTSSTVEMLLSDKDNLSTIFPDIPDLNTLLVSVPPTEIEQGIIKYMLDEIGVDFHKVNLVTGYKDLNIKVNLKRETLENLIPLVMNEITQKLLQRHLDENPKTKKYELNKILEAIQDPEIRRILLAEVISILSLEQSLEHPNLFDFKSNKNAQNLVINALLLRADQQLARIEASYDLCSSGSWDTILTERETYERNLRLLNSSIMIIANGVGYKIPSYVYKDEKGEYVPFDKADFEGEKWILEVLSDGSVVARLPSDIMRIEKIIDLIKYTSDEEKIEKYEATILQLTTKQRIFIPISSIPTENNNPLAQIFNKDFNFRRSNLLSSSPIVQGLRLYDLCNSTEKRTIDRTISDTIAIINMDGFDIDFNLEPRNAEVPICISLDNGKGMVRFGFNHSKTDGIDGMRSSLNSITAVEEAFKKHDYPSLIDIELPLSEARMQSGLWERLKRRIQKKEQDPAQRAMLEIILVKGHIRAENIIKRGILPSDGAATLKINGQEFDRLLMLINNHGKKQSSESTHLTRAPMIAYLVGLLRTVSRDRFRQTIGKKEILDDVVWETANVQNLAVESPFSSNFRTLENLICSLTASLDIKESIDTKSAKGSTSDPMYTIAEMKEGLTQDKLIHEIKKAMQNLLFYRHQFEELVLEFIPEEEAPVIGTAIRTKKTTLHRIGIVVVEQQKFPLIRKIVDYLQQADIVTEDNSAKAQKIIAASVLTTARNFLNNITMSEKGRGPSQFAMLAIGQFKKIGELIRKLSSSSLAGNAALAATASAGAQPNTRRPTPQGGRAWTASLQKQPTPWQVAMSKDVRGDYTITARLNMGDINKRRQVLSPLKEHVRSRIFLESVLQILESNANSTEAFAKIREWCREMQYDESKKVGIETMCYGIMMAILNKFANAGLKIIESDMHAITRLFETAKENP